MACLVPSGAMDQVPKPGLVSLRFIHEVVCGSLTISAAHSEFSEKRGCFLTAAFTLLQCWSS